MSKKILSQQDLSTQASLTTPDSGFVGFGAKSDGLYEKIGTNEKKLIKEGDLITPRVQSVSSGATVTPNSDSDDAIEITAQAVALTIANPSGTPVNFQKLLIRIKDNGTARTISFGTSYASGGVSLPTTTIASKILTLGFMHNTANSLNKWQLIALSQEV